MRKCIYFLALMKGSSIDDMSKFRLHQDYLCDSACHANSHPLPPPPLKQAVSLSSHSQCAWGGEWDCYSRCPQSIMFFNLPLYLRGVFSEEAVPPQRNLILQDNRQYKNKTKQILCNMKLNNLSNILISNIVQQQQWTQVQRVHCVMRTASVAISNCCV